MFPFSTEFERIHFPHLLLQLLSTGKTYKIFFARKLLCYYVTFSFVKADCRVRYILKYSMGLKLKKFKYGNIELFKGQKYFNPFPFLASWFAVGTIRELTTAYLFPIMSALSSPPPSTTTKVLQCNALKKNPLQWRKMHRNIAKCITVL